MRLISEDRKYDVPYESVVLIKGQAAYDTRTHIVAIPMGTNPELPKKIYMGSYSDKKLADKELYRMRYAYDHVIPVFWFDTEEELKDDT